MKKFFFLFFLLSAWQTMFAQDKIVTVSGDTILCRIVSVSNDRILYQQKEYNFTYGKTILTNDVAKYFWTSATPSEISPISGTPAQP